MTFPAGLFELDNGPIPRGDAAAVICRNHYLRSFPSGWTYNYHHDGAVVVFSIPANKNLGPFLFAGAVEVRELARLWAPDGHRPNLLTEAISTACRNLRGTAGIDAVVSFADPNQGHHGGIYQAASWIYTGQSTETRVYIAEDGRTLSRRAFHSGSTSLVPNITPVRLEGKHRYVRPLTTRSRKLLRQESVPYPKWAGRGSAPASARRVPRPADDEPYSDLSAVGTPGLASDQYPRASSRSAQSPQYPSQPSPYSENVSLHSLHVATSLSVRPPLEESA